MIASSLILTLLDNPVVLDLLITGVVFLASWGVSKLMALLDSQWANEHLSGVGAHIRDATEAGAREYVRQIDVANDDGVITDDERHTARKAALDLAMSEIGLGKLSKALGRSRGAKASETLAKAFVERGVDKALEEMGILPAGSKSGETVASGDGASPLDETKRSGEK